MYNGYIIIIVSYGPRVDVSLLSYDISRVFGEKSYTTTTTTTTVLYYFLLKFDRKRIAASRAISVDELFCQKTTLRDHPRESDR